MGKKITGLLAVLGAVVLALAAAHLDRNDLPRYHQHLEAPGPGLSQAGEGFCTHLPLVSIHTGGQAIPGEQREKDTILATLEVRDGGTGDNALTDPPTLTSAIRLRYRGNTSLHFDKKPYRVKLVEADGTPNAREMMGMPREDEWILNGPFLDKSLLRNYMLMNLCGQVLENTPEVRYCELFVDGAYQGVYLMMESISRSQAGVGKSVKGRAETSYVVRLDRGGTVELDTFSMYAMLNHSTYNVVYPSSQTCTPEQADYIQRDLSQFEKALYSLDYDDPKLGYRAYIDVGSFVDYMVLNEFFQNYDATRYSTYLTKEVGGKLSMGPVWDFNNALDNYMADPFDATGFGFPDSLWYHMLLKDPRFTDQVIRRYRELRGGPLSDAYLTAYIDQTVTWLGPAVDRNFQVWGYTFQPEHGLLVPAERNLGSHEEAVAQMKDFLLRRGAWLDENIQLLEQFCHPSATKQYQH